MYYLPMTSPTPLNPMTPMTPVDLFLLGRTLMKIGEDALPAPRSAPPLTPAACARS